MDFVRSVGWSHLAYSVGSSLNLAFYDRVFYEGFENIPHDEAALVLPKHISWWDIPLEGIFLKKAGRYGNWVMKSDLPCRYILRKLGGVEFNRPRDVRKIVSQRLEAEKKGGIVELPPGLKGKGHDAYLANYWRNRRKTLLNEEGSNTVSLDYCKGLYNLGEIIVSHPEGTRNRGFVGPLRDDFVVYSRTVGRELGKKIVVVPMGIELLPDYSSRGSVCVRAGEPLDINSSSLMDKARSEIARLSNVPLVS